MTHPRHEPTCEELLDLLGHARDEIQKQNAVIASFQELFSWALGDGPLPRDIEAERAAWAYLRALADEPAGWRLVVGYARRLRGLLTTRCPRVWSEPGMPWSEVVKRLQAAAELRRAMGRTKEAMRRGASGDRIGMIRALRGAVDVFGEPSASKVVELQWRAGELEARIRELEAVGG